MKDRLGKLDALDLFVSDEIGARIPYFGDRKRRVSLEQLQKCLLNGKLRIRWVPNETKYPLPVYLQYDMRPAFIDANDRFDGIFHNVPYG